MTTCRRFRLSVSQWYTARTLAITIAAACVSPQQTAAATPTPLVTGNGFGFAVYSPTAKTVSRFYTHPYKFKRPDPKDPLSEGEETASLIKGLAWKGLPPSKVHVDYFNESHIITVFNDDFRQAYFMPFGLDFDVLIATCESKAQAIPTIEWEHAVKEDSLRSICGRKVRVLKFKDANAIALLVALTAENGQNLEISDSQMAIIGVEHDEDIESTVSQVLSWHRNLNAKALIDREIKEVESWRVDPKVHFRSSQERNLWRQSEVILRMAQSREPNRPGRYNHGLIIASLPDGAWFVPWVRDMAYATIALLKMGHRQEAQWAVEAYLNARPTGKMQKDVRDCHYQISVARYFGNGEEEPFFTGEGATNIEFDDWGLALWLIGEFAKQNPQWLGTQTYRGSVCENALNYIVKPLLANLDPYEGGLIVAEDTSIWEERQKDKKHFAYSTAAAIKGLEEFVQAIELAKADNRAPRVDPAIVEDLKAKITKLRRGYAAAFVRDSRIHGTLESGIKNDVDGANLAAITFGVVSDDKVIRATVDSMSSLLMPSGGYRRVHSIVEDPAIFEYWYERQEFLFIDFLLAEVYLRLHEPDKAAPMIKRMVAKAALDHNIIPEMYVSRKTIASLAMLARQPELCLWWVMERELMCTIY